MNNNEFIKLLEAVYITKGGGIDCEDVGGMSWFDARDRAVAALPKEPAKLPVDALIYAALLLRLDTGNIESVVNSKTVSEYERDISRLIESVRAAQQEKTK